MPNKTNITTGRAKVTGCVYRAALGTALPTNATTALASEYKELGYVSEDGLTNSNSPTVETVKDWSGSVVAVLQSDREDTFAFAFLESKNADVLKSIYGESNVTEESDGTIKVSVGNVPPEEYVWVFEMALKDGKYKRIVLPDGMVTALGDISYTSTDLIMYNVTLTATADSTGHTHYEYIS